MLVSLPPPLKRAFSVKTDDPKQLLKYGADQQVKPLSEMDPYFVSWFIGFSEGKGCWYISNKQCVFSIHLNFIDLPTLT